MSNKKGVSLVTVMLFMVIATIAATATYKWLSSEQSISANRMRIAEAQQASKAGLEAVRAWMTFHANDVGSLIHQYNVDKEPVYLNNVVIPFGNSKQKYDVWLTGVDAAQAPYKLKITSVGESQNGAKYSEVSILKVDGLYRVTIPQETMSMGFDQAFAGKVGKVTSDNVLESAIINGDLGGNIPNVTKNLLVTGSVTYQGGTQQGKDLYIKGNFSNQGSLKIGETNGAGECVVGKDTNVVYIGGSITNCANKLTVCGDMFVNGSIAANCGLYVSGNLTVNGDFKRYENYQTDVRRNLVFAENGRFDVKGDNFGSFQVGGNFYMPKNVVKEGSSCSGGCGDGNGNRRVNVTGKLYRYSTDNFEILGQTQPLTRGVFSSGTQQTENENTRKDKRYFSLSTVGLELAKVGSWSRTDNVLKNLSNNYWARIDKMDAYGNLIAEDNAVPQPLLLKDSANWLSKIANTSSTGSQSACAAAGYSVPPSGGLTDANIEAMKNCRNKLLTDNPNALYNGFLVLNIVNTQLQDPTAEIDGKFIFYFDSKPSQMRLPSTKEDAVVMLYFTQGAGTLQKSQHGSEYNRYFIYSEGDIDNFLDKLDIQGSAIMANGSTFKDLNNGSFHYHKNVLDKLSEAGIIKENPEYTKRASPDGTSSGSTTTVGGTADTYYVSNAPQLNITLESQYKSNENTENYSKENTVESGVIVLPRVIYLTKDAPGKLSDYFSVVNLNGAHAQKNASNVSCSPNLPTTNNLSSTTSLLAEGLYTCSYASDYGNIPFWTIVNGMNGATPNVQFEKSFEQIYPGGSAVTVSLNVPGQARSNMTVDVVVSSKPEKWIITPKPGVAPHSVTASGSGLYYTITVPAAGGVVPVFDVRAEAGATNETVVFQLVPPTQGCNIGDISTESVMITGSAEVHRVELDGTFCASHDKVKNTVGTEFDCSSVISRPNCGSLLNGEWVIPYCQPMTTDVENQMWTCGTNMALFLTSVATSPYCDMFIYDTITTPQGGTSYSLHASLKRKPKILNVNIAGENVGNDVRVVVKSSTTGTNYTDAFCTDLDSKHKQCNVYAGDYIQISHSESGSIFSNWTCDYGDCMDKPIRSSSLFEMLVSSSDESSVTIHYNDRDDHCFYDNFSSADNAVTGEKEAFKAFCPNNTYRNCVDKCAAGESNCSVGDAYLSDHAANWRMVYPNKYELQCEAKGLVVCRKWKKSKPAYVAPSIVSGVIRAPDGGLLMDYSPSVLLNTVKAGFDGEMTVMMRIPLIVKDVIEKFLGEHYYDDGIVLRSDANASKYISLNVYSDITKRAMARVCYVEGPEVSNKDDCIEKPFSLPNGIDYVMITAVTNVTVKANIHGSQLDVEIDYNFGSLGSFDVGTVSFDLTKLKNSLQNVPGQEYVGLKLSNDGISYSDISWRSADYANECWDTPQIYCSFSNKFIGGWVPKGEYVSPWYAMSSWFDNNDCPNPTFYYNGCDYAPYNGYSCYGGGEDSRGWYWQKGDELLSDQYKFSYEGPHGYAYSTPTTGMWPLEGFVRNASVRVVCNQKTYTADCGPFNVGSIEACSEHREIFTGNRYCTAGTDCEVYLDNNSFVNAREATIYLTINDLVNGEVSIELVDFDNNRSQITKVFEADIKAIKVDDVSDNYGFDPQKMRGVILKGTSPFSVTSVQSSCPNALGISNCEATYNGSAWKINSTITNPRSASACTVTDNEGNKLYENDCPLNGSFEIGAVSVYQDVVNSGLEQKDFAFTIEATAASDNSVLSCVTNAVTIKKQTLECDVSVDEITVGGDLPYFRYYVTDCPDGGCGLTLTLEDKTENVTYSKSCTGGSCTFEQWAPPNFNATAGTYTYSARTTTGATCSKEFAVVANGSVTADDCHVDGTSFKASINASNEGHSAKLYYTDPQGHVIGSEQSVSIGTSTFSQDLSSLPAGNYTLVLMLDGSDVCSIRYSSSSTQPVDVTCPAAVSNQDPSSVISVTPTVTGCDGGCNWSVSPATADGSGSNYTSGEISFYNASGSGTVSHTLTVSKGTKSDNCTFNVTYAGSSSSESCHCADYCGSGCENNMLTGNQEVVLTGCMFITTASFLNLNNNGNKLTINGKNVSNLYADNQSSVNSQLASYATVDGGYYIYAASGTYANIKATGQNPCEGSFEPTSGSGGGSTSSSSAKSSSSAAGGGGGAIAVTVTYGSYVTYEAGKTYNVTLAGGSVFRCRYSGSDAFDIGTFNGSVFKANQYSGGQATISNPGSGTTVTFVVSSSIPYAIECATDW